MSDPKEQIGILYTEENRDLVKQILGDAEQNDIEAAKFLAAIVDSDTRRRLEEAIGEDNVRTDTPEPMM